MSQDPNRWIRAFLIVQAHPEGMTAEQMKKAGINGYTQSAMRESGALLRDGRLWSEEVASWKRREFDDNEARPYLTTINPDLLPKL